MATALTHFRVESLHGLLSIDMPIKDNILILVGENGSGKSTVVNMLYYFLTNQWNKLLDYKFESISTTFDGDEITVTRKEIISSLRDSKIKYSPRFINAINEILTLKSAEDLLTDRNTLRAIARSYDISFLQVHTYLQRHVEDTHEIIDLKASDTIKSKISEQILYLPTYRRIEQDLISVFPLLPYEYKNRIETFMRNIPTDNYIEMVQFGMQDVEDIITQKMNILKDTFRTDLNKLTTTFLRDVLFGNYRLTSFEDINKIEYATIDAIISQIDPEIIPLAQQGELKEKIQSIKQSKVEQAEEKVVAHFLIQLAELYKRQQGREMNVLKFIEVCNVYLHRKVVYFDNKEYQIIIQQLNPTSSPSFIPMSVLSSGEKQIVSLFSHVYLSEKSEYFIIIDEPELSLSVPWQERFLPDILDSGKCKGLIAVTHSPFIFKNKLKRYVHSLEEFMGATK